MNPISVKNWRAGASLIAGLLLAIAPYRASGQPGPVEGPSNIECLERLEMPDYPPLAGQARVQVIQTVKVLLSDEATIQAITQTLESRVQRISGQTDKSFFSKSDKRALGFPEGAERAVKNSRFSKACGGKTITLVFHYEIREDYSISLFAFGPPNHFWIRYGPVYVNPQVSGK
jgi:hypothetical protein